jgi:hypothetical protein
MTRKPSAFTIRLQPFLESAFGTGSELGMKTPPEGTDSHEY